MKADVHREARCYGLAIFLGGFESPGFHCLDGFCIEAQPEWIRNVNVDRQALFANDKRESYNSLVFHLARGLAEYWLVLEDRSWRTDAMSDLEQGAVRELRRGRDGW